MPPIVPRHPSLTYFTRFVLLMVLYAAVNWLSLTYLPAGTSGASLIWPVSAVGVAGLLFWGLDLWPALLLPMFLVLVGVGFEPPLAAGVAVGNTLEAVVGAYILLRAGFHPMMSRLRDSLALILAAFVSTFFSASIIMLSAAAFYTHAFNSDLWVGLWVGHTVSLLSFGPFVIRWGYRPLFTKTWGELGEGLVIFGVIFVLSFLLFWTPHGSIAGISLIYILIFPLIWASLRAGPRGIALALLMMTLISVSGVLWGFGPITKHATEALFGLQTLLGTLSIIFLLFTSITEERKEAVIALEGHVGQLENALEKLSGEDRAKSEFIAILAHELRNPLSPVLSGLEILKTRTDEHSDIHQMMGAHLNTLARLLDDLLDITRISQNKFRLEREHTTLQTVLTRSLEMAKPYLDSRKHTFEAHIPAEDIAIVADPVRLTQVFVNLLNNAAKYTPEGGLIELSVERAAREAIVRVRDNGQGIVPERMNQIFEAFAGGPRRNEGPGGLHIGLSLAKRMIELHQGSIEARSAGVGSGSEFIVHLPLPAEEDTAPATPDTATKQRQPRGRFSREAMENHAREAGPVAVLVVDDNEAAAQMLATLLSHNGHEVTTAHTGFKAIEEATRVRPQVALLDIGLPDISGYEVGRRLRAQFGYDIALVALTGYGQEEDRERAKASGFDEHLVKPVSIVDVERTLAKLKRA